jgi:hypothetical protein
MKKFLQRIVATAATAGALSAPGAPALVGSTTATAVLASGAVLTAPTPAEARTRGGRYAYSRGTNPNAPRRWMKAAKAVRRCSKGPCVTSEYAQYKGGGFAPGPLSGGDVVPSYAGPVRILY